MEHNNTATEWNSPVWTEDDCALCGYTAGKAHLHEDGLCHRCWEQEQG